ncbi:MAG: nitrile hydratase subunit beta [Pseudomonadota bacterium]
MNGPQDLGGMMGFGPVLPEADEPVFHAEWERRAFAITVAAGFTGQWNIDRARAARESLPPARYLASSYYEIWFEALRNLLVEKGMIGEEELASGRVQLPPKPGIRAMPAAEVPTVLARGGPSERAAERPARFAVGDRVRARVMHPAHHTRLPRYLRGKRGVIESLHGAHVFPDAHARGLGEAPQWLYTVRFEASEVWGADTTADSLCADCWEPYLEVDRDPGHCEDTTR